MADPNYIAAKTFLNLLPDAVKVKLCNQVLAGVEDNKKTKKQRVKDYTKWLANK
ncbi:MULTISPECIES: hypothetical protein [unclassified Chryseobacterium]|uniref:hypothetical protein n=1 Tax=unclassified Chryseobacterium TaxID=2593645 RepID=UPI002852FDDA|nr:hypothetical protein [Chryseobacterium sp. CFS7]MDR4892237.1 hypothetical protein [Chryseobacterium sp. CFS7]